MTMLAASMAIAVGSQALPVVGPHAAIANVAHAAEAPSASDWDPANIVEADAITPTDRVNKGVLDGKRNVVWGYLSYADRGTMEVDDMRNPWSDTPVPEGADMYMRYDTGGGKMSRIHKATTHTDDFGNTVYAFEFKDGSPKLAAGTWKDGSADVQLLIGENNSAINPHINEPFSVVRATPGGAWYSGSVEDSRNLNWSIHPVAVNDRRGPTWGETVVKVYQVSPASNTLKSQLSETPDKAVKRTYSGRVWNDSMKGTNTENVWAKDQYNINVDNGVLFDGTDTPAEGHTVYQAVPNDEAYQALDAIRRDTNTTGNRTRADIQGRIKRTADYVRAHPENFTVYSAPVKADGTYTLRSSFDQARHADYVYMWVEDADHNIKTNLSSWNTSEFRAPVGNDVYTESGHAERSLADNDWAHNGHVPGQRHLGNNAHVATAPHRDGSGNWTNVNFALATNADGSSHTVTPGQPDREADNDANDPTYGGRVETPRGTDTVIDGPKNTDGSDLPGETSFEQHPTKPVTGPNGEQLPSFPGKVEVDPGTGKVTVNPDDGAREGNYDIPVKVTYPDGTTDTVDVEVTVPARDNATEDPDKSDTENFDPYYQPAQGKPGVGTKVEQTQDLPKGSTFAPTLPNGWTASEPDENGDFTVTPAKNARPGKVDIPVLVTYPDGSQDTVTAPFTVLPLDKDTNDPRYEDTETPKGEPTEIDSPKNPDGSDLPEDTTFKPGENDFPGKVEVDPGTGKVTVTPDDDATPGDYEIPVEVTYPDDSEETTTVTVTVPEDPEDNGGSSDQAAQNDPGYGTTEGAAGKETKVSQNGDRELPKGTKVTVADAPEGWTFGEPNAAGDFTVTPDKDAFSGTRVTIPVRFTYPDGTIDDTEAVFVVTNDTADNDPAYKETKAPRGKDTRVDAPTNPDGSSLPEDTTFEQGDSDDSDFPGKVTVDPGTGEVTLTPDEDATPGDYTIPVDITYPDGTEETIDLPVLIPDDTTITPPDNGGSDNGSGDGSDDGSGDGSDDGSDDGSGDGSDDGSDDGSGDGSDDGSDDGSGDGSDDGSDDGSGDGSDDGKDNGSTDAVDNDPAYSPGSGPAGTATELKQDGDRELPEGTKFVLPKAPAGWTFGEPNENGDFTVTPPESALPGTAVSIPVSVVYPDGSRETVNAPFEVVGTSDDATDNEPVYDGDTKVEPGDTETVDAPRNPDGSALPDDTKFEHKDDDFPGKVEVDPGTGEITVTPDEDAKPGKHTVVVEVTYPDGTTDTVEVPVEVIPADSGDDDKDDGKGGDNGKGSEDSTSQADNNNPGYENQRGLAETPVKFEQNGDRELPEGTTFVFPKFPSGWTLDGDADTGDFTIKAPANTPNGTEVTIPVIVSYPDGSNETLSPIFTVGTTSGGSDKPGDGGNTGTTPGGNTGGNDTDGKDPQDSDAHDPTYGGDRTTTPREQDTVIEGPKNEDGSDLPKDTTFAPGKHTFPGKVTVHPGTGKVTVNPDKDAKGGSYDIPVVVTYPDGSNETITVPVQVPPQVSNGATVEVKPGDTVTVGGDIDPKDLQIRYPDGTIKDISELNPGKDADGNITITVPKDWAEGTYVVETKDGDRVVVIKVSSESQGTTTGSSELSDRCIAGLAGVGIPLLLLIPLGVATQVAIPGLEEFRAEAGKAIEQVNTQIQQQLGIFDEQFAQAAQSVLGPNFPARELGTAAAALALTALGLLIADQIAQACAPEYDGLSSKIGGGEGAKGSSSKEDAKKNEADEN
ncbi:Rib/alpha-like domain-containing protein [Corynebacterium hadale]|uniref:Rib/alpha-like domain-containing protein n=1 Tax=Corynebacterium hadale TaxID=2026255 RepID=UPI0013FDBB5C|nr:Rib/alpha-like domain-containing protein [Corynebacterium hadale]